MNPASIRRQVRWWRDIAPEPIKKLAKEIGIKGNWTDPAGKCSLFRGFARRQMLTTSRLRSWAFDLARRRDGAPEPIEPLAKKSQKKIEMKIN